jgi:dolichol-phosphate mannosyltransferase
MPTTKGALASAAQGEAQAGLCDLSVLIPALDEAENLRSLVPSLHRVLQGLSVAYEILVVGHDGPDETLEVARRLGARPMAQTLPGYGGALTEGFRAARGRYLITMDADLSHEPDFISKLWANRDRADIVIASRYVRGGVAYMPLLRKALSRVLNRTFTNALSLDLFDISSGFRLYRADVLRSLRLDGVDFDLLPEIALRAYVDGWRIAEVPFTYFPRARGSSQARILRVGANLLKTFARLWRLRHSIEAADYDERAFYSLNPVQRWWQRKRHRIITRFARSGGRVLDVGCGSSVILQSLNHAVGVDIRHPKMRYMRRYGVPLVTGSIFALPFADRSMDCVVCSEVIEHVPADPVIFAELDRVLRPGGLLILGTPDYATWSWPVIERLYHVLVPGGYADEHIAHYTRPSLAKILSVMGYRELAARTIAGSELIILARKGDGLFDPAGLAPWLPRSEARR